jgi:hypothetical protein
MFMIVVPAALVGLNVFVSLLLRLLSLVFWIPSCLPFAASVFAIACVSRLAALVSAHCRWFSACLCRRCGFAALRLQSLPRKAVVKGARLEPMVCRSWFQWLAIMAVLGRIDLSDLELYSWSTASVQQCHGALPLWCSSAAEQLRRCVVPAIVPCFVTVQSAAAKCNPLECRCLVHWCSTIVAECHIAVTPQRVHC